LENTSKYNVTFYVITINNTHYFNCLNFPDLTKIAMSNYLGTTTDKVRGADPNK